MKTISMPLDEYNEDIRKAEYNGKNNFYYRSLLEVLEGYFEFHADSCYQSKESFGFKCREDARKVLEFLKKDLK